MLFGRKDNLEARYSITFCVKMRKILQTAYGLTSISRTSVFRWYKRFKDGRQKVKGDEKKEWKRDIRSSELLEKIRNFLHEDCHMSIRTISLEIRVGVASILRIIDEDMTMCHVPRLQSLFPVTDRQKDTKVIGGRWLSSLSPIQE
ncbi:protein GVQW3-like [Octopus bimaculoides]|uniref:protein GVQW3-like n=1 Tax=Octopus bimaculoides TaxID=37653 RepID=UPI00071C74F5|nr:protein GVQW3-like [Octopus bimaculoides]|eukprot:XP_014773258.1 PREDICTED: putative uncharacterized protein FLJ37770 [Octopus bimaculoides]